MVLEISLAEISRQIYMGELGKSDSCPANQADGPVPSRLANLALKVRQICSWLNALSPAGQVVHAREFANRMSYLQSLNTALSSALQ